MSRRHQAASARMLAVTLALGLALAAGASTPAIAGPAATGYPAHMAAASPAAEALWQRGTAFYDRNDFRNAFAAYSQAAALGHPRAMATLGNMYREGEGVAKDPRQAARWYEQAARLGNRGAQYSLGSQYEEGEGVPRNVAKAAQLYEVSARQGMPEAQFALGLSYEFGEGVPRNRRTAIFWLDQVARQGDGRAQWYADWLRRPDTPQFRDEADFGRYTAAKVGARMAAQMAAGASTMSGVQRQYERNQRAADLDRQGEGARASACRESGSC